MPPAFKPNSSQYDGTIQQQDPTTKLTSVPDSLVGKDVYGQNTGKYPTDSFIGITSPDPNGRENPNAGDFIHTLNPVHCRTCDMEVSIESLANPATAHLGHDMCYDGKENFDVNQSNASEMGKYGGSYFLQPMKNPSIQNPGQYFPEEKAGDTLGTQYRWQADVDRSTGRGNNAKRPVLPGGGDLSKSERPYAGDVLGRLSNRLDDTDPPVNGGGLKMTGPTSNAQYADAEAGPDTLAHMIEDHTL